ncbi:hypothetical protein [Atlantibacter subterraneus]|uniref:hypothetical protein n=1 Tax=Atlantibacter subterraneus TaxID=255519 RepID=UPI002FDE6CF0
MQILAPRSTSSAGGLSGGSSAAILIKYQTQLETANQGRNNRIIKTRIGAPQMKIFWLDYEKIRLEDDLAFIKKSIESPTVKRPEWVKSGRDFVKWMKMRKEG